MRLIKITSDIGSRIRVCREFADMTQAELSAATGLSQTALSALEQGKVPDPRVQTLFSICQVLDISLDTFLKVDPSETDEILRRGSFSKRRAYHWYMRNYGHRLLDEHGGRVSLVTAEGFVIENPPKHLAEEER